MKKNFIVSEVVIREVIKERSVDWFILLDQVKVSVFLVKGVERVTAEVSVVVFDGSGPFGILGRQFSETFDEGKEVGLVSIVQCAGKAMARWKREDAGKGSDVVVFEDFRQVGNQVREGKIEAEVLFGVVVRREGDGVSDGMLAHPRFKGRGVFRIGADFDGNKDELGDIVEREFSGANVG